MALSKRSTLLSLLLSAALSACTPPPLPSFPEQLSTSLTDKHQQVLGTKLFGVIPEAYHYNQELMRYQKKPKLYLQFLIFDEGSFTDSEAAFSQEALEAKGATVTIWQPLTLNEFEGVYVEGPSKYPDETKLMLIFGDDDFVAMLVGVCKNDDLEGKEELKTILQSIYYQKDLVLAAPQLTGIVIDWSITGYEYASNTANIFFFTENGILDEDDPTASSIGVMLLPPLSPEDAKTYLERFPTGYASNGIQLEETTLQPLTIGKHTVMLLHTPIVYEDQTGVLYIATVLGKEKTALFIGSAFEEVDDFVQKCRRTIASVVFESESDS